MWARVVESMLGCWLAVSPFIFQHGDKTALWVMDFASASAVITLALLSYWRPMRYAHLGITAVALVMIIFGRVAGGADIAPGFQNHIVVGLLLLMFAIVPNDATHPTPAWRAWYREGREV